MDKWDFASTFMEIQFLARSYGAENSGLHLTAEPLNERDRKRFLASCHRGYERAQSRVADEILQLREEAETPDAAFQEAALRKILDQIVYVALGTHDHLFRRLSFLREPPRVEPSVIRKTLEHASKLNRESRQTFALAADLTTSVHVADLFRVDFRGGEKRIELIELKEGKVNEFLLEQLEHYEPTPDELERLEKEKPVDKRYMNQAKRIMRQQIRVAQVEEVWATDHGTDIATGKPLVLTDDVYEIDGYDEIVDQLCRGALENGKSAATVNHCLHIGCAYSEAPDDAEFHSAWAAEQATAQYWEHCAEKYQEIGNAVKSQFEGIDWANLYDPLRLNVFTVATKPFPMWMVHPDHLKLLVSGKMALRIMFDLPGAFCLGSDLGIDMRLSGKRAAGRAESEYGSGHAPNWGGRMLEFRTPLGWSGVFYGTLLRILAGFSYPYSVFGAYVYADRKQIKGADVS